MLDQGVTTCLEGLAENILSLESDGLVLDRRDDGDDQDGEDGTVSSTVDEGKRRLVLENKRIGGRGR